MGVRDYVNLKYLIACIFCFVVLIFALISVCTPWYFITFYDTPVRGDIEIVEYLGYIEFDGDKCWTHEDCYNDDFKPMFGFIIFFGILVLLGALVECIFLLMLSVSFLSVNNTVRKILRIVVIVLAVLILIFVILAWTIIFDHVRLYRDTGVSLDPTRGVCDNLEAGGPNCLWAGYASDTARVSNLVPGVEARWGPHAGWVFMLLNTLLILPVLGLAIWGCVRQSGTIQNENDYQLYKDKS